MTTLNTALDKIIAQQAKHKQGSAPWCVGEQLQNAAHEMMDLADALTAAGRAEEATRLRTALDRALQALAGQMNEEK